MNVEIDTRLCKAYANCTFEAPEVFEVDDATGKAHVILEGPLDGRREEIERAVEACPAQAIGIID